MYHCEIKPSLRPFFICSESVRASSNCSFSSGYFSAIGTRFFTGVNCMARFDYFKSAPSLLTTALFLSKSSVSKSSFAYRANINISLAFSLQLYAAALGIFSIVLKLNNAML